jgi:hypothetical protein
LNLGTGTAADTINIGTLGGTNAINIGTEGDTTTFAGTVIMPSGNAVAHLLNHSAAEVSFSSATGTEILNTTTGLDNISLSATKNLLITYSAEVTDVGGITCEVNISKVCILDDDGDVIVATATPESVTIADEYNYGSYKTVTFFVEGVTQGVRNVNVTATTSMGTSKIAQQTLTVIAV